MRWVEIADRVWVVRNRALDLNLGLVIGRDRALAIDTGMDNEHGAQFVKGIAERTSVPCSIVLTHAHFDHLFGTSAFGDTEIYAHPVCAESIGEFTEADQKRCAGQLAQWGMPEESERLLTATLIAPNRQTTDITLDLGDRSVRILHPGRGHTGGDLIVHVPDAATVFAGDLVEEGPAGQSFADPERTDITLGTPLADSDAYPSEWPATMDTILALNPDIIVPGHGNPVNPEFVARQRDQLTT